MRNVHFFRRKLAHRLRDCAARRRRASAGDPSGDDLKIIALCERLASDAEQLPQGVIDDVAGGCADPAFARGFDQVWDTLADIVGVLLVPRSATDLVRWMIHQASQDAAPSQDISPSRSRPFPAEPSSRSARRSERIGPIGGTVAVSCASDFTGAVAVVGPMLAVWEVAAAVGQWRDRAFATSHPGTEASVVAAATNETGRGITAPSTETLAFTLPGGMPCRAAIQLGTRQPDALGQALVVVPRSERCEVPLIPGTIGDPGISVLVALAFAASSVASLRAWTWLQVCRAHAEDDGAIRRAPLRAAL